MGELETELKVARDREDFSIPGGVDSPSTSTALTTPSLSSSSDRTELLTLRKSNLTLLQTLGTLSTTHTSLSHSFSTLEESHKALEESNRILKEALEEERREKRGLEGRVLRGDVRAQGEKGRRENESVWWMGRVVSISLIFVCTDILFYRLNWKMNVIG